MNDWSDEETDDPLYADRRNFYKYASSRLSQRRKRVQAKVEVADGVSKISHAHSDGRGWAEQLTDALAALRSMISLGRAQLTYCDAPATPAS